MFKNYIRIFTVLLIITAILGCGKKDARDENVLQFWHAMGGPLGEVLTDMVDDYNKTNPPMKVKLVNMGGYTALSQKITGAARVRTLPALAQVYEAWTVNYYKEGLVVPAQKFIDQDTLFQKTLDDIFPAYIEGNTTDGKLISFPFNKSVRALYYNKDLLKKYGYGRPPETWDEFLEYCKTMTVRKNGDTELWGTAMVKRNGWSYANLLLQFGGEFLTPDKNKVAFNSEPGIKALEYLRDLIFKHNVAYTTQGYEYQNDFLAGKVAMIEGSTVSIKFMGRSMPEGFNLGIAPVPAAKRKAMIVQGTNVAIFSDISEEKQKAAWEFVKWFTNTENTARWSMGTFYLPVRKSVYDIPEYNQWIAKYDGLRAVYDQLDYAAFEPDVASWVAGRDELVRFAVSSVLIGKTKSAEAALDDAAIKIQLLLDREEK